jgi:hypothetical protein
MSIFTTRKPRHFERQPYYSNPRKDELEARVRRIKRELGQLDDEEFNAEESIRGSFVRQTTHLKRRKESDNPNGSNRNVKIAVWLIVLIVALYFLLK